MSDETFPVALAGRTWELPHLPFRVIKKAQPLLMRSSVAAMPPGADAAGVLLRLDEGPLDDLSEAAWLAVNHVEPMSRDAFLDLPFAASDLLAAIPSLMKACGLKVVARGDTRSDEAPAGASEKK